MNRRPAVLVTALIVGALALAGCGHGGGSGGSGGGTTDSAGRHTVNVVQVPSTLFAPLYVAQARGYFAANGLTLNLSKVTNGQTALPLTASGKADVLVAGFSAGLFSAAHSGLEFKVVGSMGASTGDPNNSPTALEVRKGSNIRTVADLKGKKVGLSGGPSGAGGYQLFSIIGPKGLTLKDVTPVSLDFPDMENALKTGAVDAAVPPAPFSTAMQTDGVAVPLAVPPKGTISSGVVYGQQFAGSPYAQPFFNALVHGAADLQKNPKDPAILQILADATGQKLSVLQANPSYTWSSTLAPDTTQLDAMQKAYAGAGLFDFSGTVPNASFVDASFAQHATATPSASPTS